MADSTNPWRVGTEGIADRAVATLPIAIPITLSGKDASGVEFTEKTRTIVIDKFGGKVASKYVLSLGSEMTLHNPIVGQTGRIRVVWVGEKQANGDAHEIGVQLLGSQNVWGIEFPTYDLRENALPASPREIQNPRMPEGAVSSPEKPGALKFAAPNSSPLPKPGQTDRTGPSLPSPTMQASSTVATACSCGDSCAIGRESNGLIEATLTRLTQQIEAGGENEARLFPEKRGIQVIQSAC